MSHKIGRTPADAIHKYRTTRSKGGYEVWSFMGNPAHEVTGITWMTRMGAQRELNDLKGDFSVLKVVYIHYLPEKENVDTILGHAQRRRVEGEMG